MLLDKVYFDLITKDRVDNSIRFAEIYKTLDAKTLKKILCNFKYLKEKYNLYDYGIINNIVFDINEAIEKCELSDVQSERLSMWMDGYTEQEIGDYYGVSRWVVSKSIVAASNKIGSYLRGVRK